MNLLSINNRNSNQNQNNGRNHHHNHQNQTVLLLPTAKVNQSTSSTNNHQQQQSFNSNQSMDILPSPADGTSPLSDSRLYNHHNRNLVNICPEVIADKRSKVAILVHETYNSTSTLRTLFFPFSRTGKNTAEATQGPPLVFGQFVDPADQSARVPLSRHSSFHSGSAGNNVNDFIMFSDLQPTFTSALDSQITFHPRSRRNNSNNSNGGQNSMSMSPRCFSSSTNEQRNSFGNSTRRKFNSSFKNSRKHPQKLPKWAKRSWLVNAGNSSIGRGGDTYDPSVASFSVDGESLRSSWRWGDASARLSTAMSQYVFFFFIF